MDSLWNRFFGEMHPFFGHEGEWLPSMDVSGTESEIGVRAELPGLEAEDIDLDVSGDVLSIRGEKKGKEETKEENYHTRESYYGSFQRSIRLPCEVQSDNVEASFKNGVLDIRLHKSVKTRPKKQN
jgi:HSP20 family protein